MAVITEPVHAGEFILSEANRNRSRDVAILDSSVTVKPGTVVGRVLTGTLAGVATAKSGNTGNGVMGAVTVAAGTPLGDYNLEVIEPGSNVGTFRVEDPNGVEIGHGAVASAFSAGGLGFTLADGATDFISGDGFKITVSSTPPADVARVAPLNPAATNGLQHAVGISWDGHATGAGETQQILIIARSAEVKSAALDWGGASGPQIIAATAELAALGIVLRS